jgi:hypothetical protein
MSAFAHRPAFEIHLADGRGRDLTARYLSLRATGDGWSLLSPEGHVVFWALGLHGRRRCLEFARAAGVLAVLS